MVLGNIKITHYSFILQIRARESPVDDFIKIAEVNFGIKTFNSIKSYTLLFVLNHYWLLLQVN